jgi:phage-related protein
MLSHCNIPTVLYDIYRSLLHHDELKEIVYPSPQVQVGRPAPHFKVPAVVDGEIKDVSLDDSNGKWRVLFFYPKVT